MNNSKKRRQLKFAIKMKLIYNKIKITIKKINKENCYKNKREVVH